MCSLSWLLAIVGTLSSPQQPFISEFMASNDQTLKDSDGDSSDWIEIDNPTANAVDVGGWYLTDDSKKLKKWRFPSPTIIDSLGQLLVFASEKDRTDGELHTNFKLKSEGEYLALVAPDGSVVHEYSPEYPEQYTDVSYGIAFAGGVPGDNATYFMQPTPLAENGAGGPALTEHHFEPPLPADGEPVTVSVRIRFAPGSTPVDAFLRYRVMFGDHTRVDLHDDGANGDASAGDGIYSAVIPGGVAAPRQMLRWILRAHDDQGGDSRLPTFANPNDSPEYFGTIVDDPTLVTTLPVFHWFVKYPDRADRHAGTRSSLWFNGRFYDNMLVHTRGNTSEGWRKHPYKFDFNHGDKFAWKEGAPLVDETNVNSTYSDKAFIREVLAWETYRDAGVHGSDSYLLRLQQNGEFFSVAILVEEPEEEMLERLGMDPNGALYKMYNELTGSGGAEKKSREWDDHSDLDALVQGIQGAGDPLDRFLFDNVDLPKVISYIAATTLMHDNDHIAKNYYVYRDSDGDGEWEFLPWDKDLTFGRNFTSQGGVLNDTIWANDDPMSHPLFGDRDHPKVDGPWNRLIDACHRSPRVRQMYVRRLRTLMDELLDRTVVPFDERHYESRCEELYQAILPDTALDEAKWGVPDWGIPMNFRTGLDQLENDYLKVRRRHLFVTHVDDGLIPDQQIHAHVRLGAIERDPASGNPAEAYVEIVNDNDAAVDLSGWTFAGGVDFSFVGGSVIPAHESAFVSPNLPAFRHRATSPTGGEMRLVLGPYQGSLKVGEPLMLVDRDGIVVATTEGPTLSATPLKVGEEGRLVTASLDSGEAVAILLSLTGAGPLDTSLGTLELSPPLYFLGMVTADVSGVAEVDFLLPPEAQGVELWLQGVAVVHKALTNGLDLLVE